MSSELEPRPKRAPVTRAEIPPTFYRLVYLRVWLRASPSTSAEKVSALSRGAVIAIESVETHGGAPWGRLHPFELHHLGPPGEPPPKPRAREAWVLIDGSILNLPLLLEPVPAAEAPPLDLWSLPHRLFQSQILSRRLLKGPRLPVLHMIRTENYGARDDTPWPHATSDSDYLCYWRAQETRLALAGPVGYHGDPPTFKEEREWAEAAASEGGPPTPRCAVGTMLRGAPPESVANFIRYHLAIGFERVYLCFDDPKDAAVPYARRFERADGTGAHVVLLSEAFWREQRRSAAFFTSNVHGDPKADPKAEDPKSADLVEHFERGDVQARQMASISHVMRVAKEGGIEWLLHVDIDEIWYSPHPAVQTHAPIFFGAVPKHILQLTFLNHEAVPPPGYAPLPPAKQRLPAKPGPPADQAAAAAEALGEGDGERDGESQSATGVSGGGGCGGGGGGDNDDDDDGAGAAPAPCWFEACRLFKPHQAFTRGPKAHAARQAEGEALKRDPQKRREKMREAAHSEERLASWNKPLEDRFDSVMRGLRMKRTMASGAWGRSPADVEEEERAKAEGRPLKGSDEWWAAKFTAQDERRARRAALRTSGDWETAELESDESDQEARREELAQSQDAASELTYFHAHEQGKSAVRLHPDRPELPLPSPGIHLFGKVLGAGDSRVCTCYGPGAPVVLHYANCGFRNYVHKYRMLTLAPTVAGAKQSSLGQLPTISNGGARGARRGRRHWPIEPSAQPLTPQPQPLATPPQPPMAMGEAAAAAEAVASGGGGEAAALEGGGGTKPLAAAAAAAEPAAAATAAAATAVAATAAAATASSVRRTKEDEEEAKEAARRRWLKGRVDANELQVVHYAFAKT